MFAGKTLHGVVMVNAYPESIWGMNAWTGGQPSARLYASAVWDQAIQELFPVQTALVVRNLHTYGTLLNWGVDSFIGMGSGKQQRAAPLQQQLPNPTAYIAVRTEISLEGNTISLIPTAELKGALMVHLPGPGILIVGNSGTYLPDAGSIVRTKTDITRWIENLTYMTTLAPSALVPVHGKPVTDASKVLPAIQAQLDSLQYIRDQTLIKINQQMPLDDIAATVALPASLSSDPYAKELTSRTSAIVRAVYHHYMGWFDGDPVSLYAMSSQARAARLIALAGGERLALARARECLGEHTADGAQNALEVASALRKVYPSPEATAIYVQALKVLAFSEKSAHYRNYYLSAIQQAQ